MKAITYLKTALVLTFALASFAPTQVQANAKNTVAKQATGDTRVTFTAPTENFTTAENTVDVTFKVTSQNPDFANKSLGFRIRISDTNAPGSLLPAEEAAFPTATVNYGALGSESTVTVEDVPLWYKGKNYITCVVDAADAFGTICGEGGQPSVYDTLTVNYTGSELPVYRFWSPTLESHFYTISSDERRYVENTYPDTWNYEKISYYASTATDNTCDTSNTQKVYRFWSPVLNSHFYTISESEKDYVIATYPGVWNYERVAYCAATSDIGNTKPVYRFWSPVLNSHFYTISESEKDYVIATYPGVWNYERVAFYALETAAGTFNK